MITRKLLLIPCIFFAWSSFAFAQTNADQSSVTTTTNINSIKTDQVTSTSVVNVTAENNPYGIKDNSNLIFINTAENPGPVYVNTGNVEEDTKNYVKAKEEWIKANTIPNDEIKPKNE